MQHYNCTISIWKTFLANTYYVPFTKSKRAYENDYSCRAYPKPLYRG